MISKLSHFWHAPHARTVLVFALVILGSIIAFGALGRSAMAANPFSSIKFPIAELGNCASFDSCKTYCDDSANADACTTYAQSHGLSQSQSNTHSDQPRTDSKAAAALKNSAGPGGCTSQSACRTYCDSVTHIKECVAFGKTHGLLSSSDLKQGEKLSSLVDQGIAFPGGCTSKDTCETYCLDSAHSDECLAFAQKTGLLGKTDLAQAKKFHESLASGTTPGGCKTGEECKSYCNDSSHRDECVAFGKKAGFVSDQQAQQLQSESLSGPGGCNSAETCDAFCNNPSNQKACAAFAQKNGFDIPQGDMQQGSMRQGDMQQGNSSDHNSQGAGMNTQQGSGDGHQGPPPGARPNPTANPNDGSMPQNTQGFTHGTLINKGPMPSGTNGGSGDQGQQPPNGTYPQGDYQGGDHNMPPNGQYNGSSTNQMNQQYGAPNQTGQQQPTGSASAQQPPPPSRPSSTGAAVLNAILGFFGLHI